jgi:hypothetical protein
MNTFLKRTKKGLLLFLLILKSGFKKQKNYFAKAIGKF